MCGSYKNVSAINKVYIMHLGFQANVSLYGKEGQNKLSKKHFLEGRNRHFNKKNKYNNYNG